MNTQQDTHKHVVGLLEEISGLVSKLSVIAPAPVANQKTKPCAHSTFTSDLEFPVISETSDERIARFKHANLSERRLALAKQYLREDTLNNR